MAGLGYVFGMFSSNLFEQLIYNAPLILLGATLVILNLRPLLQKIKPGRRLVGSYILITLTALAFFSLLMLFLQPTSTSFGNPFPVIFVFGCLYLNALGVSLTVCRLLLRFYRVRQHWRWLLGGYATLHFLLLVLLTYAFYVEPLWVEVTQTTLTEPKLSNGTSLKIVLLSDIHMERWTRREDEIIKKLNEIKPDLILISGDHINIDHYTPEAYADLKRFFKALKASQGVYAVEGVVDPSDLTREAVSDTPVQLIEDTILPLTVNGQTLQLIGLKSNGTGKTDLAYLRSLLQDDNFNGLRLLLYHTPNLAREVADIGIDLYLAGHTHGGQIALPFLGAIFTASATGRSYTAGLYNLGGPADSKIYVTRGIGLEGANMPRARLFARPEISVITLVGSGK